MSQLTSINAEMITDNINLYTQILSGYFAQFLNWGKWLFYSFAAIAIVWQCVWLAFDKESAMEAMPAFLREFFTIALFYTIMLNAGPWLSSIVDTAQSMSQQLTHQQIDPASIIQQGLTIANKVLAPIKNSGILTMGIGTIIIAITYLAILTAFIAVGLNLATTLIITTFFISLSGFSLAFCALPITRSIARRTLDVIIGNSFKLLTLYLVIFAGSNVFTQIAANMPLDHIESFDIYAWTLAAALLFWSVANYIPKQAAKLFSDAIQENQWTDTAKHAIAPLGLASPTSASIMHNQNRIKMVGGAISHSVAHFNTTHLSHSVATTATNQTFSTELTEHFQSYTEKAAVANSSLAMGARSQQRPVSRPKKSSPSST